MFSVDWHSDFDAVQRRGRGSIQMGQECPQPSKVPFRVDGKPVCLMGWAATTLEWVVQFGTASFLSWSVNGRSAGSGT